jgi:uncharacterized membrane protein YeiH
MQDFIYFFDLFGTSVFALTGVLAAAKHRMDLFGMLVLATVTAIGGGTVRDMILGATPCFWLLDLNYLWIILATVCLSALFLRDLRADSLKLLPLADALGLALFSTIGASKALDFGYAWVIAIFMGVLTGVGGGMIRDVLCQRVPFVLQGEIYAVAAVLGSGLYSLGTGLGWTQPVTLCLSMSLALALRLASIRWALRLPVPNLLANREHYP